MTFKQRKICLLSDCALTSARKNPVAVFNGELIDQQQFHLDVCRLAASFCKLPHQSFALYYEEAYPFCVSLFALLHSHKQVLIAANNKAVTAKQLIEQNIVLLGNWEGKETSIAVNETSGFELTELDLNNSVVTIFTSGSSGQAKQINKTLQQFQNEIEVLERYWGESLADAQVMATVSHQHIYGLLFRVLWPLAAGRCFYSEMFLSPEPLFKMAKGISAYWVASPAQLKRLDELSSWTSLAQLKAIFSSGGALSIETAAEIFQNSQHQVIEVYGSSETGGVAWRKSVTDPLWTLFEGIHISVDSNGISYLSSPYLATHNPYKMDDKIELLGSEQFKLLGRLDRIVKVEEKRLSLDELELALNNCEWVQQSYTLLVTHKKDKIAAVVVLSASGQNYIQQQGRAVFIKQLRKQLMSQFETVVLPKKWLFMTSLPMTAQAKVNRELLTDLLSLDPLRMPQILSCHYQDQTVELECRVSPNLIYFAGHFPEHPILPGVTQLAWAEKIAALFFNINAPFLRMEVIKFKKIIHPGDVVKVSLSWQAESGKLYFDICSATETHSSGRMVYGEQV